jgi:hypothetical protein
MFKIQAEPTFQARVDIPVAGAASVPVIFTFKHRSKDELDAWRESTKDKPEHLIFMECVEGWARTDAEAKKVDKEAHGLDEDFTEDNVKALLQQRIGTAMATYVAYAVELTKHKEKN